MSKILRIDLTHHRHSIEEIPSACRYIGGRGLIAHILKEEVLPTVDPLSDHNKLIFACGVLAGTAVPNSSRLSVGGVSPLTKTVKEANAGGTTAQVMAQIGLRAIIIEGRANALTGIRIDAGSVSFFDAEPFKGMGNYQLIDEITAKYGDKTSVVSIGPGGEKKLLSAGVSSTGADKEPRMAARGGLGAVMGAKNLKCVVLEAEKESRVQIDDPAAFKAAVKSLAKGIASHPIVDGLKNFGTPMLVGIINDGVNCLATRNYRMGKFEGSAKISGEHIAQMMAVRPNAKAVHRCMPGCIISCSNVFASPDGNVVVTGLEFETIALLGSNLMIDDIDAIAKMNRLCNDIGVDTMEVGAALGVAMEAKVIAWGDADKAIEWIHLLAQGKDEGLLIGNGCVYAGEQLGIERVPHVKGQGLAAYDPRGLKGTGVTYATSPMGADHTCGNAVPSPANPDYNPSSDVGQGPVSQFLQIFHAAIDSLGLCLFASIPLLDIPELRNDLIRCVSAATGMAYDPDYLEGIGKYTLKTERAFNLAAGFTAEDDRLPAFFTEEKLPETGNFFNVSTEELDGVHAY
ncbi:MAG: aldehyde ferredoxin oxidoreductase C-terminal domain-containing protein [Pseudomonadota bacterium]